MFCVFSLSKPIPRHQIPLFVDGTELGMIKDFLLTATDSDPSSPQLRVLVIVFCGTYGGLALLSFITFGFLIKRGGCVLTRHAVFFFLLILVVCSTSSHSGIVFLWFCLLKTFGF
jgi:hypothetical protein